VKQPDQQPSAISSIQPWDNLSEPGLAKDRPAEGSPTVQAKDVTSEIVQAVHTVEQAGKELDGLPDEARKLNWDCVSYSYDGCIEHQRRLNLSARKFEQAKAALERKGLIQCLWFGQTLFLVPTDLAYRSLSMEPPKLKRRLTFDHSFAVHFAAYLIGRMPLVSQVEKEMTLGGTGATVDIVARMKDGSRQAWEVTLHAGNVGANAAKSANAGFSRIVFVCRDTNIKQAAWSSLKNSGLEPELLARCRVILFSTLLRQQKALRMV